MSDSIGLAPGVQEVNNNLSQIQRTLADISQFVSAISDTGTTTGTAIAAIATSVAAIETTLAAMTSAPILPSYTVAGLPAGAAIGQQAYATNGRKPGEGGGAGSGTPVWFDVSSVWFAVWSGLAVTS